MDKITGRDKDGCLTVYGDRVLGCMNDTIYNALARLEEYEETGLSPDDIVDLGSIDHLRELVRAENDERCVVLDMPRKPLVWGDDEYNTCLCPYCGKDLMGIPYGERMVLQCPECGQYLDATKTITREEAEAALKEQEG